MPLRAEELPPRPRPEEPVKASMLAISLSQSLGATKIKIRLISKGKGTKSR